MRHDIVIHGSAFRLRPVALADAAFIVALRTDPAVTAFIRDTSPDVGEQERWLERYFQREGDYYFIIERIDTGAREGTVGLYDLDTSRRAAEWGRWIVQPGSLGAIESALLIYRVGFSVLDLEMLYCRTLDDNQRVISFHTSCGLVTHERLVDHAVVGAAKHDAIEQRLSRSAWPACEAILSRGAAGVAKILSRDRAG